MSRRCSQRKIAAWLKEPKHVRQRKLLRVESEYFVAGAVFEKIYGIWSCTRSAPIIRWMMGKQPAEIKVALLKMEAQWEWLP